MNTNPESQKQLISKSRKNIYYIVTFFLPFLFFIIFELFLRAFNYGDNYDLFIDFKNEPYTNYKMINTKNGEKYFQYLDYTRPGCDMFLKKKPDDCFRIFVLGSSTVVGFPYDQNLMFTRILQKRLQDSYPDKKIEVVNTAITAINSFTLLDYMKSIVNEKPDAILIYAGHNEFYGALGVGSIEKAFNSRTLTLLHLKLLSFKGYQLLQSTINTIRSLFSGSNASSLKGTLMKRIVGNKNITYKSDTYRKGIDYYKKNMSQIAQIANHYKIPIYISEVCSNTKDIKPFASDKTNELPAAIEVYNKAQIHEVNGKFEEAKKSYAYAKDLDAIRFRASEEINEIVKKVATDYDLHLVKMTSDYFERNSPNAIVGNNLMTEHVHPNIQGYFLMANAFYDKLIQTKIIGELDSLNFKNSAYYKRNWGYTELDSLFGYHQLQILLNYWPYKPIGATAEEYRRTYKPNSKIDSMAFKIANNKNITLEDGHLELAEWYLKKGDYYNAFREYNANMTFDPFQIRDKINAIQCLLRINDLPLALQLTNELLEVKESYVAYMIKSDLLLIKSNYTGAMKALKNAYTISKNQNERMQVLINKHKVYHFGGFKKEAQETLKQIHELHPGFQPNYTEYLKPFHQHIPIQVEKQVLKGIELYEDGQHDKALTKLHKTLEIKETALANKYIGDILFAQNNSNAILYYEKAFSDFIMDEAFLYQLGLCYSKNHKKEKIKTVIEPLKKLKSSENKISSLESLLN